LLMADDDLDDYYLLREAIRATGTPCGIGFVTNGQELLDYLLHEGEFSDRHSHPKPDLILLDLNMPLMDGYSALGKMKSNPGTRDIPVVVFTTSGNPDDIEKCYRLGANSFIQKPADFNDFVRIMDTLMRYWFQVVSLPDKFNAGRFTAQPAGNAVAQGLSSEV